MPDYGFLDEYNRDIDCSDESRTLASWLGWLDLLLVSLMARQSVAVSADNGRVGLRTPKERIVEGLLPGKDPAPFPKEKMREMYRALMEAGKEYREQSKGISLWTLVFDDLLAPEEVVALLLAAAAETNRKYETAYDVLTGGKNDGTATVGLAYDLCALFMTEEELQERRLYDTGSVLMRYLLVPDAGEPHTQLSRVLKLQPYAYQALLNPVDDLASMALFAEYVGWPEEKETLLREDLCERLVGLLQEKKPGLVALVGPEGAGKKYIASKAAGSLGRMLVRVRMEELLTAENDRLLAYADEMVFRYLLYGNLYYLEVGDLRRFDEDRLQLLLSTLMMGMGQVLMGTTEELPSLFYHGEPAYLKVERIPRTEQAVLWKELAKRKGITFAKDVDLSEMVSKYDLLPGKISDALYLACVGNEKTKTGKVTVTKAQIEREINLQSDVHFGTLASKIQTSFTREDIYLTEISKKEVDRVLARIRYRSVVNEDYGFGRNLPYGRGVSVVLYGPPGTGKTMLASVIANELNLSLYRIDLSQMSSKYIGETEKNIAGLFAAARNSNGILFFDEADALFAKRTEVSGSNDRYANAETAFLLQQIEAYDGLSILATNAMQNFDSAFKRRMTFMIPMERPNEEERLELWKHIFPKDVPLEKDVRFEIFAKKAELTGSAIKAAALDAAYTAAARGDKVSMQDLIDAVDLQCRRNGITGVGAELMMER